MGVCCGASESKPKSRASQNKESHLAKADPNSSMQVDVKDIDSRVKILQRGIEPELEHMINTYDANINSYIFGQNKTLLLEAVIKCPNAKVVDMIMSKGADVDKEELQTGNTAIFLSALDLKVDFVEALLKYKPNLQHRNNSQQNIFEFLQFQLFDQRKSLGRELMRQEKEKYDTIISMLRRASGNEDVEQLDK